MVSCVGKQCLTRAAARPETQRDQGNCRKKGSQKNGSSGREVCHGTGMVLIIAPKEVAALP